MSFTKVSFVNRSQFEELRRISEDPKRNLEVLARFEVNL